MDCNTHARTDFYATIYGFFVLPVAIALYIAGLTVLLMWVLKPAAPSTRSQSLPRRRVLQENAYHLHVDLRKVLA